jgi:hypothetical protein
MEHHGDVEDNSDEDEEQQHEDNPIVFHLAIGTEVCDHRTSEPGRSQGDADVEGIWTERIANGHVSQPLPSNKHGTPEVREGGSNGRERQSHDDRRCANEGANAIAAGDHHKGEGSQPHDRHDETERVLLSSSGASSDIREGVVEEILERQESAVGNDLKIAR